ncbi:MAG: glycosyltransferase family 2 protein, partial [bacterium]|nr:glycosyltransferase family 2 protein [bacterium]
MKLSVIVPVYNEKNTISQILEKVRNVPIEKEIIIVDGNSIDGTKEILAEEAKQPDTKVFYETHPRGRGAALKLGMEHATGEIFIFQDGDLELDPADYPALIAPIETNSATVVFGSRFLGKSTDYMNILQLWGNRFLTALVNLFYGSKLTDVETCYQVFRAEAVKNLEIKSNDFNFTVELAVKLIKKGYQITEIPIKYTPRSKEEGKKVRWKDGFTSLYTLI